MKQSPNTPGPWGGSATPIWLEWIFFFNFFIVCHMCHNMIGADMALAFDGFCKKFGLKLGIETFLLFFTYHRELPASFYIPVS
jgi:hypothetical protein